MSLPPITQVLIAKIRMDGDTQQRVETDQELVEDYAEKIDIPLPPIVLFGTTGNDYWPGDGHHRIEAHVMRGRPCINAYIYPGGERDAILYSTGPANRKHGRQLTKQDNRRRVLTLLRDPEWQKWPTTRIAEHTGVPESTVRLWRQEWEKSFSQSASSRTIVVTTVSGKQFERTVPKKQKSPPPPTSTLSAPRPTPVAADTLAATVDRGIEMLQECYAFWEPLGKKGEHVLRNLAKAIDRAKRIG